MNFQLISEVSTPVQNGVLQCKCPRCSTFSQDVEQKDELKKQLNLQHRSTDGTGQASIPPVVHEVLFSSGKPLDSEIRAFMETRLGHDFSKVRVHTDSKAAESARAVNALAYTVGQDVVFGAGQYAPRTSEGKKLLSHELVHVVQQGSQKNLQNKLAVGEHDDVFEKEADNIASRVLDGQLFTQNISPVHHMVRIVQRAAIHRGNILDEGDCAHLACNSKYACKDNNNGITCPKGTRNASETEKYRPLFTCDTKCENNKKCSDSNNWMAIPKSRFARSKCNQDLVICANGKYTHAYVRDRSEIEAWEASRGIQDKLGVSPYATFTGSIYGDESDPDFAKDIRCHTAEPSKKIEAKIPPKSEPPAMPWKEMIPPLYGKLEWLETGHTDCDWDRNVAADEIFKPNSVNPKLNVTSEDNCTKSCTTEHEKTHKTQLTPVCKNYFECYTSSPKKAEVSSDCKGLKGKDLKNCISLMTTILRYECFKHLSEKWDAQNWECQAYKSSLACAQKLQEKSDKSCSGKIGAYIYSAQKNIDKYCTGEKKEPKHTGEPKEQGKPPANKKE